MTINPTRIDCAVTSIQTRVAPDLRVTCFDPDVTIRGEQEIVLTGTVETEHMRDTLVASLQGVENDATITDEISVLETEKQKATILYSEVPAFSDPSQDSERVTSALYGTKVDAFDQQDGWRRIRTADGYLAWVDDAAIEVAETFATDAVLTKNTTRASHGETLFAGTPCKVITATDETVRVRFRTGGEISVSSNEISTVDGAIGPEQVIDNAKRYLGTEYVWGGMTTNGIDCSGLVWQSYFQAGVRLPRDTDQQRELGRRVPRDELHPGDLLFFPGHVALSLGGSEYIHASGSAGEVTITSFDPMSDCYVRERDEDFDLAKRLI